MSETVFKTAEQEWLEEGQLLTARAVLRDLLEERFGPLPAALTERIEQTDDIDRLRAAIRQVYRLSAIQELDL